MIVLITTISALILQLSSCSPDQPVAKVADVKLENHPIYSNYTFGESPDVIDIGIQPLWLPPGIITEVMRHDTILKQALSSQGKEVRFHQFLKGADVNYFLGRGNLEVGVGGDMPALGAVSHHNAKVASMIQQGFCSIVARKHIQISDLQGEKVGVPYSSNAHFALIAALSGVNLTINDITPVFMDVTKMPEALENKDIYAYTAWEPTPSVSLNTFDDHIIIHKGLSTGYLYFSNAFYRKNPELAKELVAAQIRAMHWIRLNRSNLRKACKWAMTAASSLSKHQMNLTESTFMQLAENDLLGHASSGLIPESDLTDSSSLAKEFTFLQKLDVVPTSLKWSDAVQNFDRAIIVEVLRDGERFKIKKTDYSGDVK